MSRLYRPLYNDGNYFVVSFSTDNNGITRLFLFYELISTISAHSNVSRLCSLEGPELFVSKLVDFWPTFSTAGRVKIEDRPSCSGKLENLRFCKLSMSTK